MSPAARKGHATMRPVEWALLFAGAIGICYVAADFLKPLVFAVLLSFTLTPVARRLERVGLPRGGAIILTVAIALGLLGGVGYVVGEQLTALVQRLPDYQGNIETKLRGVMNLQKRSVGDRLSAMVEEITANVVGPEADLAAEEKAPISRVEIGESPSLVDRLRAASGPYLEFLGVAGFVLILVLFMLMSREDLRDRIVGLFGQRHVGLTIRTMEEIGQRISRYLATLALVNSGYGIVVGVGLAAIGLPYATLWGCLAALLRFIPYIGPAAAFALPLIFSFAHFPGWVQPVEVAVLFGLVEVVLNAFLEPIIYGRTTGLSALGLLIAAMF